MSAHDPSSDLSRINRFGHERAVEVDPWTAAVIERSLYWSKHSEGAFDVVAAGAAAVECGTLPLHPRPAKAESRTLDAGWRFAGFAVRLLKPGVRRPWRDREGLCSRSRGRGDESCRRDRFGLVNAGGDIAGFGPDPWPVQVVDPQRRRPVANVAVSNGAIATSSIHPRRERFSPARPVARSWFRQPFARRQRWTPTR